MASITMTASFLAGSTLSGRSPATTGRRLVITNSAKASEGERVKVSYESKKESNNGRRDLMFAAAAAAVCSVAGVAVAEGPQRGTPEAKKIYAPVCVTMPTAKICHK
uniref:Photosystem II 5 kDa protein n=1 Tax=Davidia involucrata TaxID=16924 RepID=A0A5B7AJX3_DAVIN